MSLYGIRLFQEFGNHVYSPLFTEIRWDNKIQHAECRNTFFNIGKALPHAAPSNLCVCGFYANWTLKDMLESANSSQANAILGYNFLGIGLVEAFGKVILHERGFKSEYMRIIGFLRETAKTDGEKFLNTGRKLFGFPIITTAERTMYLDRDRDYGRRCANAIGVKLFDMDSAHYLLSTSEKP